MRIDKLLANMGFGSRKEMKKFLKTGQVTVNGKMIKDAKTQVHPEEDQIYCQGEPVYYQKYIYLMMNKPQGVISATEDALEETVLDLIDPVYQIYDPFPVGRLDKDTEGLLLLTNDGQLAHQLLSPKKHVPKTYLAEIEGNVTAEDQQQFRKGILLDDGYMTRPSKLEIIRSGECSEVKITIFEGKFHQIKRMFSASGKRVTFLKRLKMGGLLLDPTLALGEYRELTDEELIRVQSTNESS